MKLIILFLLACGYGIATAQNFTVTLTDANGTNLDLLDTIPDAVKIQIQSHDASSEFQLQKAEVIQVRGKNRVGSVLSYGPLLGVKWWFGTRLPGDRYAFNVFIDQMKNGKVVQTSQKSFVFPATKK